MNDKNTDLSDNITNELKPKSLKDLLSIEEYNKANLFDSDERKIIGRKVFDTYDIDKKSREKKETIWKNILELINNENKEEDVEDGNRARINYPLILDACRKWAKNAYPIILKSGKIVKAKVVGDDKGEIAINEMESVPLINPEKKTPVYSIKPGTKLAKAQRRVEFENYYIMNKIENYEDSLDELSVRYPLFGCMFRKVSYESNCQEIVVQTLFPHNVIVNNTAKDNKYTCISQELSLNYNQIKANQNSGIFLDDVDLKPLLDTEDSTPVEDEKNQNLYATEEECPQEFIEQYNWMDLDGDGFLEPYRVVVHKESQTLMGLYPRYTQDSIKRKEDKIVSIEPREYFVKYPFYPSSDGSYYDDGFGDLLFHTNHTINTLLNQLIDAGTLSNKSSGFISKALKKRAGNVNLKIGEYKFVDMFGVNIRDAILPIDHKEPSVVLFELLKFILMGAKELVGLTPAFNQEMNPNIAPMTMMAFVEEGAKEFKATYKRFYRSLKKEIILIENNIRDDVDEIFSKMYVEVLDNKEANFEEDYKDKDYDIVPLADADVTTDFEKNLKLQTLMGLSQNPVFLPFLKVDSILQYMLLELGFDNIADITQIPPPAPEDPMIQLKKMELNLKAQQIQSDAQKKFLQEQNERLRIQLADMDSRRKIAEQAVKSLEMDHKLAEMEAKIENIKTNSILNMANANKVNREAGQTSEETTKQVESLYEPTNRNY